MDVAIFGASESIDETQDLSLSKFSNDTEVAQEPSLKMESTSYSLSSGDKEFLCSLEGCSCVVLDFLLGKVKELNCSICFWLFIELLFSSDYFLKLQITPLASKSTLMSYLEKYVTIYEL